MINDLARIMLISCSLCIAFTETNGQQPNNNFVKDHAPAPVSGKPAAKLRVLLFPH